MRKKILPLLTALCLVLSMLPTAAMAADAASELGYSEDEIAMYVSESTEIAEDQIGLVVVAAPVEVGVRDAKLPAGLLIAPGAEGAKVTLGENADVNAVIIMAASEVVVEEAASAVSITAAVPGSEILVAGSVQVVTIAAEAAGTAVVVSDTAAVSVLEVAAPDVSVKIAGSVEAVAVADTASGIELVADGSAAVGAVTGATGGLTISGPGAAGIEVERPARPEAEDTVKPTTPETGDAVESPDLPPVQPPTPPVQSEAPALRTAPLEDRSGSPKTDLYYEDSYDIEVTPDTEAGNVLHVVIKAEDLVKHTGVDGEGEHAWVGIAIPVPSDEGITYSYYLLRLTNAAPEKESVTPDASWTNAGVTYDLFYFNTDGIDGPSGPQYQIGVVAGGDALAGDAAPEFILDLAFEITHAPDEPPVDADPATPAIPGDDGEVLEPIMPEAPDKPEEPIMPEDPPEEPVTPKDPDNPEEPVTPEDPDEPLLAPEDPNDPPQDPLMLEDLMGSAGLAACGEDEAPAMP